VSITSNKHKKRKEMKMVKLNSLNIKKEKQIIDHDVHRKTLLIRQQPCAPLSHSMNRVDVE